jgi:phenylacetate-CoA ligase
MSGTIFNRVYGNVVVATQLRGQRDVPFLPKEKIKELRDKRLQEIVIYAAGTVPYYRALFQNLKLDPREIKTAEDLDKLPLLDKDTVRKDPSQFVSTSRKGKNAIPFVTSGTTGKPLQISHDVHSLLSNIAFGEREKDVIVRTIGPKRGIKELHINYSTSTLRKVTDFYQKWTLAPARQKRISLSVLEPLQKVVETIRKFHPDIIVGYGSYLETLFKTLHSRGIGVPLPAVVIYVAEAMSADGRKFIEEKFGVPVLSRYNAIEAFKIGFICEKREGFHIHPDLCHVKIAGDGLEKGELVISNLVNHGTVLFNYRIGDVAAIMDQPCSCGRTFPLLRELEGRVEDIIHLSNGEFIHPRAIWNVFKGRSGVYSIN